MAAAQSGTVALEDSDGATLNDSKIKLDFYLKNQNDYSDRLLQISHGQRTEDDTKAHVAEIIAQTGQFNARNLDENNQKSGSGRVL